MRAWIGRALAALAALGFLLGWLAWVVGYPLGWIATTLTLVSPLAMVAALGIDPQRSAELRRLPRRLFVAGVLAFLLTSGWVVFIRHFAPYRDWSTVGIRCRTDGTGSTPRAALNKYYRGCLFRPTVRSSKSFDDVHGTYVESVVFFIEKRRGGDYAPEMSVVVGRRQGSTEWAVDPVGEQAVVRPAI